jgi:hypothetical protein
MIYFPDTLRKRSDIGAVVLVFVDTNGAADLGRLVASPLLFLGRPR